MNLAERTAEEKAAFILLEAISAVGVVVVDGEGRIVLFNARAQEMFAYPLEEVLGKTIESLIPEGRRSDHARERAAYAAEPRPRPMGMGRELAGRRRDGSEFHVEVGLTPIRIGGRDFVAGFVVDISVRKELEQKKDELIALASHEIRNPLASIVAALSILDEEIQGRLSDDTQHHFDIALRECLRLRRLLDGYLSLEKIESGGAEFKLRATPVAPLAQRAVEAARTQGASGSLRFELTDGFPGGEAFVDPDRLEQAVANLLSNAAKFAPPGTAVTVSISDRGESVRIAVADQGPGISEEFRAKLFRRFAQDRTSPRTVKERGTGLGLSIVKAIVERMRGRVGFDSRPGEGATFYVDLPKRAPSIEAPGSAGPRK